MKSKKFVLIAALFAGISSKAQEADSLGEIGDNLDLYAVLDEFKNAATIEDFEKAINDPESKINNLDLNEDDEVDYLKVIDNAEGDVHALVLQVDLSETESQDVAVIELEKTADGNATIQIIGDEDIYGADYMVEPAEEDLPTKSIWASNFVVINVWGWSSVRFVFGPKYVRWVSPWKWRSHPVWYKPWRPIGWKAYHTNCYRHHAHFHRAPVRRCVAAHALYHRHRVASPRVRMHRNYHARTNQPGHGHPHGAGQKPGHKPGAGKRR